MTTTWSTPATGDLDAPAHGRRYRPSRRAVAGVLAVLLLLAGTVLYVSGRSRPAPPAVLPAAVPAGPAGLQLVAGTPFGYPHTEAGARSAAVNYVVAHGGPAMFVPGQRAALLEAIADPAVLPALRAREDAAYAAVAELFGLDADGQPFQAGLQFVSRMLPVGVRTAGYTPDTAVIAVWENSLVGMAGQGSTRPVAEAWATQTVTLRWAAGDWKYVSETGTQGPVPVVGVQPPSDSAELATAVREFGGLSYAGS